MPRTRSCGLGAASFSGVDVLHMWCVELRMLAVLALQMRLMGALVICQMELQPASQPQVGGTAYASGATCADTRIGTSCCRVR